MKRTWPIIAVADVAGSLRWYQTLLGLAPAAPAHGHFAQVQDTDGTVLLCLHAWGEHEHPSLMNPGQGIPGNGLLLFILVDDVAGAVRRARDLVPALEEAAHTNANTGVVEFSLRDPDGYFVTISGFPAG